MQVVNLDTSRPTPRSRNQGLQDYLFRSLSERVECLAGGRFLILGRDSNTGFEVLMDWLHPARIVTLDVAKRAGRCGVSSAVLDGHGHPGPSFDAVFVFSSLHLEHALRWRRFQLAVDLLSAGGVFVAVDPTVCAGVSARQVRAWAMLYERLAGSGFLIERISVGVGRLILASIGSRLDTGVSPV